MAKVRRNRRSMLRVLEVARLRARDGRYPRTGQDRFKARAADLKTYTPKEAE